MKPVTGQYECVHSSGIGLDYFTSRVDRLTLYPTGRFVLIAQARSRVVHAAQSLASGQQVSSAAPETRREGGYNFQGGLLSLHFDDGAQQQGQLAPNGNGLSVGRDVFTKLSDSTLMPSTNRMKKDMEDIAKGLKIAGTIGGFALKAAKGIHDTLQTAQGSTSNQQSPSFPTSSSTTNSKASYRPPTQSSPSNASQQMPPQPAPRQSESLYCDQCGALCRPEKRFCNNCGARLM